MEIDKLSKSWEVWTLNDVKEEIRRHRTSSPTLALLKALASQEGVEV